MWGAFLPLEERFLSIRKIYFRVLPNAGSLMCSHVVKFR